MLTREKLKKEIESNIRKIAKIHDVDANVGQRIEKIYKYLKTRYNLEKINLDYFKNLASIGFRNCNYSLQKGDILYFHSGFYSIKGKWKVIGLVNYQGQIKAKLGKLNKDGSVSKRANYRLYNAGELQRSVRQYSEIKKDNHYVKEVNKDD